MITRTRKIDGKDLDKGIEEIKKIGFTIFESVLHEDVIEHYKSLCRTAHDTYAPFYKSSDKVTKFHGQSAVKLVYNLHNKHEDFLALLFDDNVIYAGDKLLREGSYKDSEPWHIQQTQARGLKGPCEAQQLHIDSRLPGIGYPLVLQFFWVLDEFSEENGGTRVVPGSHKIKAFAEDGKTYDNENVVACPKGSLVIVDASVWHGSSAKRSEKERWIIIGTYARWFMKPTFDLTKNTPNHIFEKLTDRQKEIMGFKTRSSVDEFMRVTRMSDEYERDEGYILPADYA